MILMASAIALAATAVTTASASFLGPTATPLAVASRLDTCGQGMGVAGTSVLLSLILDAGQGFPQLIRLNICYHQEHFLFDIEIGVKVIQYSTVKPLFKYSSTMLL